MRTRFLRTRYLTGSRIQLRYLTHLLLSMVVPVIFVIGCLYYLIFTIMAEQIGIPEYIANTLVPVVNKVNVILLFGIPPLCGLLILWGIILSHRFAGPLERLEKDIRRIYEHNDFKRRLRLRKHDDLRPIADDINRLLDNIEGRIK